MPLFSWTTKSRLLVARYCSIKKTTRERFRNAKNHPRLFHKEEVSFSRLAIIKGDRLRRWQLVFTIDSGQQVRKMCRPYGWVLQEKKRCEKMRICTFLDVRALEERTRPIQVQIFGNFYVNCLEDDDCVRFCSVWFYLSRTARMTKSWRGCLDSSAKDDRLDSGQSPTTVPLHQKKPPYAY